MNVRMLEIDGVPTRWKWDILRVDETTKEVQIRVVNLETREVLRLKDYENYLPENIEDLVKYITHKVSNILKESK